VIQARSRARALALLAAFTAGMLQPGALRAAPPTRAESAARAQAAVVGLRTTSIPDARSNDALGREREGSGVLIDSDGTVLTIGYLVIEAEEVDLVLPDGRVVPARVVAADPASGFGLVQALTPLAIEPAPLGRSAKVSPRDTLLVVSGGAEGDLSQVRLVARRAFSGSWEYQIDDALFTAPPRIDHSGASLFNTDGELLGIGSLVVADALGTGGRPVMGNMFVPIDLLKPILAELRSRGSTRQSHRPWLGVNCVDVSGQVRVVRVTPGGPAAHAGLLPGDHIRRVDGAAVTTLPAFYGLLWRDDTPEREVTLEVRRGDESQSIKLRSADRLKVLRQAPGI
jgi:serine protease Do